jgi:hypothetical protein
MSWPGEAFPEAETVQARNSSQLQQQSVMCCSSTLLYPPANQNSLACPLLPAEQPGTFSAADHLGLKTAACIAPGYSLPHHSTLVLPSNLPAAISDGGLCWD